MVAPRFNKTNPVEQAISRGETPNSGTLGPNAEAKYNPLAFKDRFVAELKQQPKFAGFADQAFSSKSAAEFESKLNQFTGQSEFAPPGDKTLADDFLAKYSLTSMLNPDEKVSGETVPFLRQQQPSEGIGGNTIASNRMKYPGSDGTSV